MSPLQPAPVILDPDPLYHGDVCFLPFRSAPWPACAELLGGHLLDPMDFSSSVAQRIEPDAYIHDLEPATIVYDPLSQANAFLGDLDGILFNSEGFMGPEKEQVPSTNHYEDPPSEFPDSKRKPTVPTLELERCATPPTHGFNTRGDCISSALRLYQPSLAAGSSEMLLRKFDMHTCGILSLRDGPNENPWRTIVWPLAHNSAPLFHAIHSLTAFHSAKKKPQLKVEGMEMMRTSVQLLARGIGEMHVETALATALVLAFAESWDVHISTGSRHLRGARILVSKALDGARHQDQDSAGSRRTRFLCNSWLYMDVIARLTSLEETEFDDVDEALWSFVTPKSSTEEIDPLMGCAKTLFPIILQAAALTCKVKKTTGTSIHVISQASELKRALELWMPPTSFTYPEDPRCDLTHSLHTAEAYRWATLLYLHQAFPEIPSLSVSQLARKVMICLAIVPESSRLLIVHIFPLLAAGCEAESREDRDWVERRWNAMSQRMQIGNVDRCREVTKEVWSRRDLAFSDAVDFDFDFGSLINGDTTVLQLRAGCETPPPQDVELGLSEQDLAKEIRPESPHSAPSDSVLGAPTLARGSTFELDLESAGGNDVAIDAFDASRDLEQDTPCERPVPSPFIWQNELPWSDQYSTGNWAVGGLTPAKRGQSPTLTNETTEDLPAERTVRGCLHWAGVMKDWNWEGRFLPRLRDLCRGQLR